MKTWAAARIPVVLIATLASLGIAPSARAGLTAHQGEVLTLPRSTQAAPLLFAFVTNLSGFDTEITISNTSLDSFGTDPQSGVCGISYYGNSAPAPQTSASVPAGGQLLFTLSGGGSGLPATPGFQGYIIANCSFRQARGVARIRGGSVTISVEAETITLPRPSGGQQYLLFPYITNQSGSDTTVVIANTSVDAFGTTPSSGTCTLYYSGNTTGGGTAPATQVSQAIPGGTQLVFTLSMGGTNGIAATPGFQGYIIAACNFRPASGFALVGDPGLQKSGLQEKAEVISSPRDTTPRPLLITDGSNANGFDTTVVIANTTADPFGTPASSGTCTLNYFNGASAPASQTSTVVAAGDSLVFSLSNGGNHGIAATPGFNGYMTASCNFPLARGYVIKTIGGQPNTMRAVEILTLPRDAISHPLLFSSVSNRGNNDTTITLQNTSADSVGSSPGTGSCTVYYYGQPANTQTPLINVPPGGTVSFTLSKGNPALNISPTPGFRGYVTADCGFPLARGVVTIGPTARKTRDFRGIGRSDVLLYNPATGDEFTGLSNGSGLYAYVPNSFSPSFTTLRTGDFNGDGKADLVVYNSRTASAYIGLSNGDGTFNFQSLFWSPGYDFVEPGDIDGDLKTDFILYNSTTGTAYTAISNGTGGFTYRYQLIGVGYSSVQLADFNGDGKADLLVYNRITGAAFLGLGDGSGAFAFTSFLFGPGNNLVIGDMSGDGKEDLLIYNPATGNATSAISDGVGGFAFTPLIFTPGFTAVRLVDYTGDGLADLIVYNSTNAAAYFGTGAGNGTFNFQSLFWSPGYDMVESEDVNGDGKVDVVLYNSTTGTAYTGISNGSGGFTYTYSLWGPGKVLAR